jgi:TetR/AcrR family transcriptional regulator
MSMPQQQDAPSRVAQRRAARRADNRTDILDAAERVFAEYGVTGGSVRKIGADSGFSAAAIYTFFESKQELLVQTLIRRAEELVRGMRRIVDDNPDPLSGLNQIIDVTIEFFSNHVAFGQLLRGMRGVIQFAGQSHRQFDGGNDFALFHEATAIITDLIRAGQSSGAIRPGDPSALAHLYEVILNEFVAAGAEAGRLTHDELHDVIGGALSLNKS